MERRRQEAQTESETDARTVVHRTFAESVVAGQIVAPIGALISFLGARTNAELLAIFDNKATLHAVKKWFVRRRLPAWAVHALSAKVNAKMIADLDRNLAELESYIGPGHGWNKNATRGLGEWRARKNLEKR